MAACALKASRARLPRLHCLLSAPTSSAWLGQGQGQSWPKVTSGRGCAEMSSADKSFKLHSGALMPRIGLGTWAQTNVVNQDQHNPQALADAVRTAVEAGYRHIDTAWAYFNEKEIGVVLQDLFKRGVVKREELFITTKLYSFFHAKDDVEKVLREQLKDLQLDYVDMYLVHGPIHIKRDMSRPNVIFPVKADMTVDTGDASQTETWKGMEACVQKGLAKHIGISNWNHKQIQRIWDMATVKPANVQVECHAYFPQEELKAFCDEKGIAFTAYSPIGSPGSAEMMAAQGKTHPKLLEDPVVLKIAKNHKKTPAQTLIRYLYDRGMVVIPKSTNPDRIKQNFDIFDFKITPEEIKELNGLKRGRLMGAMAAFFAKHPDFPWPDEKTY